MASTHKEIITQEADARFWAQTNYKPGRKLDPKDPADRAMAKVWLDIWTKVKAEDKAGRLVLTYNHPEVEQGIADADLASRATDSHVDAAAAAPDPGAAASHASAAAQATAAEARASRRAAAAQPPTVSPILTDAAANRAAAGSGEQGPRPVTPGLPPSHPAATSEAARPVIAPGPEDASPPLPPATPPTPRQHVDAARAARAASVAVQAHEDGRGRASSAGTLHPRTISEVRAVAGELAGRSPGSLVGTIYTVDERWAVPVFGSIGEAAAWYEQVTSSPDAFRYVAYFDLTPGAGVRGPIAELFGSSRAIAPIARPEVRRAVNGGATLASPPASPAPYDPQLPTYAPPSPPVAPALAPKKGPPYLAIAAGGAAVIGLAVIVSAASRRRGSGSTSVASAVRRQLSKASPAAPTNPQVQIFGLGRK